MAKENTTRLNLVVAATIKDEIEAVAEEEHRTMAEVMRDAWCQYSLLRRNADGDGCVKVLLNDETLLLPVCHKRHNN